MVRPTARSIAVQHVHIVIAVLGKRGGRFFGELADALDAVDVGGDLRENGGRVTGAGADFEHLFPALEQQRLGHEGDNVGLRYRLPLGDGQRGVLVGEFLQIVRQEHFARHLAHGVEDRLRPHPAGKDVSVHHLVTEFGEIRGDSFRARAIFIGCHDYPRPP